MFANQFEFNAVMRDNGDSGIIWSSSGQRSFPRLLITALILIKHSETDNQRLVPLILILLALWQWCNLQHCCHSTRNPRNPTACFTH